MAIQENGSRIGMHNGQPLTGDARIRQIIREIGHNSGAILDLHTITDAKSLVEKANAGTQTDPEELQSATRKLEILNNLEPHDQEDIQDERVRVLVDIVGNRQKMHLSSPNVSRLGYIRNG